MKNALDLAKYMVSKCVKDGCPISNLQLQKILYFIQVETIKKTGDVAFYDGIEAWKFGPVIPSVYYHFCGFGAMPIWASYKVSTPEEPEKMIVDAVMEEKRKLDPWTLVDEAHKKGGPWDRTYKNGEGVHEPISVELIKECIGETI